MNRKLSRSRNESVAIETASHNRQLLIGVLLGVAASVFYTMSNTAFRQVSTEVDYVLATFLKACLTLLFATSMLAVFRGQQQSLPPVRSILIVVAAAVFAQLFGSVLMQRAFAIIGIALVVPIYIGSMVAASAVLGWVVLGEKINGRVSFALAVLLVSVFILCLGGEQANDALQTPENVIMRGASVIDGVLSATTVGIAYAVLAVAIRYVMTRHELSEFGPVLIVSSVGCLMLGSWGVTRGGLAVLPNLDRSNVLWILAGGLCNGLAFSSLAASLRRLPAVYVNAINASQAALAMLVGLVWFPEPPSASLLLGVAVMLLGFTLLVRAKMRGNELE